MSDKNKKSEKPVNMADLRKPWLRMQSAQKVILFASLALAIIVAYQIIRGSGNWGSGILWGLLFGGSIWLIFYGMNWFHSIFNKKK